VNAAAAVALCKEVGVGLPAPQTAQATGISFSLLEDLAVKILFLHGELSLHELSRQLGLNFAVVKEIFERMRKEQLCEVKGMTELVYRTALTSMGRSRALELLSLNQYAGHAPVTLAEYTDRVRSQSVSRAEVYPAELIKAFEHLVLDPRSLKRLGTALVTGSSILLYGPAGTGKTTIAEILPSVYGDTVWIPYAIEVSGQIVTVYDPGIHQRLDESLPYDTDGRWVLCRRPRVIAGGELTIEMLDLHFDPIGKLYSAPLQMKANNGVLIIDDFGRQLVRPEALLNRRIVPLDRRIDFLSLAGGKKFEVPFDLFVVFASNLEPAQLGDEAFLRRIGSKIKVGYLRRDQFHEVFRRIRPKFGLEYDADVVDGAIDILSREFKEPLRSCHPGDIVRLICGKARYEGLTPKFDCESALEACNDHFGYAVEGLLGARES
jgi:predicted ATPase with chaperone activity